MRERPAFPLITMKVLIPSEVLLMAFFIFFFAVFSKHVIFYRLLRCRSSQAFGSGSRLDFRLRNPDVGLGVLRRSIIRSWICQDDELLRSVPRLCLESLISSRFGPMPVGG